MQEETTAVLAGVGNVIAEMEHMAESTTADALDRALKMVQRVTEAEAHAGEIVKKAMKAEQEGATLRLRVVELSDRVEELEAKLVKQTTEREHAEHCSREARLELSTVTVALASVQQREDCLQRRLEAALSEVASLQQSTREREEHERVKCEQAARGKAARVQASERVVALMRNGMLVRGWILWRGFRTEHARVACLLLQGVRAMRNQTLVRGWRMWQSYRTEHARAASMLRRGVSAMRNGTLARGYRTWQSYRTEHAHSVTLLRKGVGCMHNRMLSRGWHGWVWSPISHQRHLLQHSLSHTRHRQLSRAWGLWVAMAADHGAVKQAARMLLSHTTSRLLALTFRAWYAHVCTATTPAKRARAAAAAAVVLLGPPTHQQMQPGPSGTSAMVRTSLEQMSPALMNRIFPIYLMHFHYVLMSVHLDICS